MVSRCETLKVRLWAAYAGFASGKSEGGANAVACTAALCIVLLSGYAHAAFLDGLAGWLKTEVIDSKIWPTGLLCLFVYEIYMYGMEKKVQYIAKAIVAAIACSAWVGRDDIWQKLANTSLNI